MHKRFKKIVVAMTGVLAVPVLTLPAAEQKKPPVLMTESVAVSRLVANSPGQPVDSLLAESKAALAEINVVQYRLSQTVSKIEGKTVPLSIIPSSLEETRQVLGILDNGIASLAETPDNPLHPQRQRYQSESEAQMIYWQAFGARQVERSLNQLIDKTSQLLTSTIPDKNRPKTGNDTPAVSTAQRSELLKILSELNQLLNDNRRQLDELAKKLKLKPKEFLALPINANDLKIPRLGISSHMIEEQALRHVIAPIPEAKPAAKPETAKKGQKTRLPPPPTARKNPYQLLTDSSRNKIDLLTPGISHQWGVNNSFNTNNWLSTGKYLAFDVYNQLDKKQRKENLKQAIEDSNDRPMLGAAVLSRLHISWNLYLDRLEKYQLSACLQYMNEKLVNLENSNLSDTTEHIIRSIRSQIANIRMTRRHYDHYADLRSAFSLVKNSFAGNHEKLETFNRQRSCYQPLNTDSVLPTPPAPPKPPVIQPAEPVAPAVTRPVPAPKPAPEPKTQWISEQKPGSFTLQIVSSKDKRVLTRYINKHKLGKAAHVTSMDNNSYALHYGVYRDKEMAFIAQFKLPIEVQSENQIWIRRVSDIQKQVK